MTWAIDQKLHWTDHYVEYGFAVIKHVVGDEFVKPAMEEVRRVLEVGDQPPSQWAKKTIHKPYDGTNFPTLATVYEQPGVRDAIRTMFGDTNRISPTKAFQLFVTTYDPDAKAKVSPQGHLDFVNTPIPIIGSGTMFQVSLIDSEPFSGNLSIYPGSHKTIQKLLIENPDRQFPDDPQINKELEREPYEFVAEKGDMIFFHHLVGHSGNYNHAAKHTPRVVIHGQALLDHWPREVTPHHPRFGAWERSLAVNGAYRTRQDEEAWIMDYKAKNKKAKAAAY